MKHTYLLALLIPFPVAFAAPKFEFSEGDRVAFIGDAFIEREQHHGWIEIAATTQFPDRNVTFRNLGWSADTPSGESRNGLSHSQAGHEPADEGWLQLRNQLTTYKPNVIILGYGMAASLPGGSTPETFRQNLERLLDTAAPARFLIVGAPPRFPLPTDSPAAIKAHTGSLASINAILSETASKRDIPFVSLDEIERSPAFTQNGIHLTSDGYKAAARAIEKSLGWKTVAWDRGGPAASLRAHIIKKNDWFFHRSRPTNMAYIFGFRKGEQGRNAGEIPAFDALVEKQDAIIAKMRDLSTAIPLEPVRTESEFAANTPQPHPVFTVADGYQVTLWAENPLLHKPTQMNFDPQGRLWVASTETYPQIEVGQTPDDKIIVLQDTTGDGKADKSTVFADGMLIPTGLLPGDGGVYVGQSTDLLHFKDTNGDGKADVKTRVLSGFGTEDTHHNLHTLRRGPDGRIWMNQSIYTRTDTETPHGIVRLKSGGIFRFDPRDSKLETVFYGWCNAWGHQFDKYGQSFVTDGAGDQGINWGVPGAMYITYAKASKVLGSVSPGTYPKFSGLEIVESAHFPEDWQGNMITCDFRAHRVVRFSISDQESGYVTQQLDDLLRTDDVNFRPIDVKIGPDGALYIADWANPIINHGEVDFRDPRRDREHGRIWKVARKGAPLLPVRDFTKLPEKDLLAALASDNRNDREQATSVLFESDSKTLHAALEAWASTAGNGREILAALQLSQARDIPNTTLLAKALASDEGEIRAAAVRVLSHWLPSVDEQEAVSVLKKSVNDPFPRVRIESIRALAKIPGTQAMTTALDALAHPTDRFIDYALWLNVQEQGKKWLDALMEGKINPAEHGKALDFILKNLPQADTSEAIAKLNPSPLPKDGSGPGLNFALKTGNDAIISNVYRQVTSDGFDTPTTALALDGLAEAISQRQVKFTDDPAKLLPYFKKDPAIRIAAIRLSGVLKSEAALPELLAIVSGESNPEQVLVFAVIDALSHYQFQDAGNSLIALAGEAADPEVRKKAAVALTRNHREASLPHIAAIISSLDDAEASRQFWQQVLSATDISTQLTTYFTANPPTPQTSALALQAIPDVPDYDPLLKLLRATAGDSMAKTHTPEAIAKMAAAANSKGDPHRGEIIYRRPALACTACHAIGGAGGKVGPDMSSIGASAPLDYLIESVVDPGAKIKEGYHSVTIETRDGKTIMGQLIGSGDNSAAVRTASGEEILIPENMIAKKTDAGSIMPGNLINSLNEQETNDLFKFLSQLGKPGDFSASDSKAPKIYAVLAHTADNQEAASKGEASLPWIPMIATVNGRLLDADVKSMLQPGGEILVATRLQLAESTEVSITFPEDLKFTDLWINGTSTRGGKANLPAGIHHIVIRTPFPESPIRLQSNAGTFLPAW